MPVSARVSYGEETLSISEWARRWNVSRHLLGSRIRVHGADLAMRATDPSRPERILLGRKALNVGSCSEQGCEQPAHCLGLCKRHYSRRNYEAHERARRGHKRAVAFEIGSTRINSGGYVEEKVGPGRHWRLQHRVVMERKVGRALFPEETVHHKNGDKTDNRPENLELWSSRHPKGQRIQDLLEFAQYINQTYGEAA